MNLSLPLSLISTLIISLLITGGVRRYALSGNLMDIPNERSSHAQATPKGGGLGFIIAFVIGLIFLNFVPILPIKSDPFLGLVIIPLAIIGFLDDHYDLSSFLRYGIQLITAILAVIHYGIFPQPWFTNFGTVGNILAGLLTIIGFTALINFYNFMDGLDGIVASVTAIQFSFMAIYFHQPIWWFLVIALLGFLWWNWSPAKSFMGDVGSTVLGALIAMGLMQSSDTSMAWSGLAITLPIVCDTVYTLILRLKRGENIFQAHRIHIFQRLHQSDWSHRKVTLIYGGFTMLISCLILLWGVVGAIISLISSLLSIFVAEQYLLIKN